MNSIEEKKKENLTGNRGLNNIIFCEDKPGSPSIKVKDTGSTPKTAETAKASGIESINSNAATWLEVTEVGNNSAGKDNKRQVASYFLPVINPHPACSENLELLVRAAGQCRQEKAVSTISAVIAQMHRLNPAFDYGWAGFPTMLDLVIFAADLKLLEVRRHNQTFVLTLPEPNASSSQTISIKFLKKFLKELFRCRLTDFSTRRNICETASEVIFDAADSGGILLSKLSIKIAGKLSDESYSVPASEIYNYLYALFRGHCFSSEESDFDYYNPIITGFKIQPNEWDIRFSTVQKIQLE